MYVNTFVGIENYTILYPDRQLKDSEDITSGFGKLPQIPVFPRRRKEDVKVKQQNCVSTE
jgi:hypothetical protein